MYILLLLRSYVELISMFVMFQGLCYSEDVFSFTKCYKLRPPIFPKSEGLVSD